MRQLKRFSIILLVLLLLVTLTLYNYNYKHQVMIGGLQDIFHSDPLENHGLQYNIRGKGFSLSGEKYFEKPNELIKSMMNEKREYTATFDNKTLQEVIFVTAASSNHFVESIDGVASVQKYYPNHRIYYFDLGLSRKQVVKVKQLCGVEYRKFDFSKYPRLGYPLGACWWKPWVIRETLLDAPGVVWFDASIRFKSDQFLVSSNRSLRLTGGLALFLNVGHSIFSATHPSSYDYLPMYGSSETAKKYIMNGGGLILMMNTFVVHQEIMYWWLLCTLSKGCFAGSLSFACRFRNRMTDYAHCHRFDQATLSIIVTNKYRRNVTDFIDAPTGDLFAVMRTSTDINKACVKIDNNVSYIIPSAWKNIT